MSAPLKRATWIRDELKATETVGDAAVVCHLYQQAYMRAARATGRLGILHKLSRWPEVKPGVSLLIYMVTCSLTYSARAGLISLCFTLVARAGRCVAF
jgi:hypothetical protein